jgi:hypothetical protein
LKTPKQLEKQRIFLYLIIAAGIFYNLYLAFSDLDSNEKQSFSKHELNQSPDLN